MDIVVVFNGIGNQMSQYAFYLSKKCYNSSTKLMFSPCSTNEHNGSELDRLFGIKYDSGFFTKLLGLLYKYYNNIPKIRVFLNHIGIRVIREPYDYEYDKKYLKNRYSGINFYIGGWHSEKYFAHLRSQILNTFQFDITNEDSVFTDIFKKISNDNRSVSIHIRRGDYVNHPEFGGIADFDYYTKAISLIKEKIPNANFYCFSNDIEWCVKNFTIDLHFIVNNKGEKSWRDLFLMSKCRHHIMANSTFSWWGAWLSTYDGAINICPSQFTKRSSTKDIYPQSWIRI